MALLLRPLNAGLILKVPIVISIKFSFVISEFFVVDRAVWLSLVPLTQMCVALIQDFHQSFCKEKARGRMGHMINITTSLSY